MKTREEKIEAVGRVIDVFACGMPVGPQADQ